MSTIIKDYLTGQNIDVTHKPEEIVRQDYLRDNDYLPEVIYLIFRSSFYDLFIEQMSSGAIMSSITDKYFKQFRIPIIPDNVQKEIAEEVSQYIYVRKLAFENLEKAISKFDAIH